MGKRGRRNEQLEVDVPHESHTASRRERKRRKRPAGPASYERRGVRQFSDDKPIVATPLPTVSENGQVKRAPKRLVVKRKEEKPTETREEVGAEVTESASAVANDATKSKKRNKGREAGDADVPFAQVRAQLADWASKLLAAPEENVGLLRELRAFSASHRGRAAALSILTEAQVYKDLAPGYRIRTISEREAESSVSKEVAKLRAYEQALLGAYVRFVRSVASHGRRGAPRGAQHTKAADQQQRVRRAACTAASELLKALPHFNEADTLVATVCAHAADREEAVRKEAATALRAVLGEAHRAGGPTLATCITVARTLSKAATSKSGVISAEVVEPLLGIRFASFPMLPIGKPRAKKGNFKGKNKKVNQRNAAREAKEESAREQLEREAENEVVRDLREAEGEPTPQELYRVRRALLDAVCAALFNVVHRAAGSAEAAKKSGAGEARRTRKPPPALAPALHGLLRVAEYISIDVVEAILAALAPLLDSQRLPLLIRLRCLSAAYAILAHHARSAGDGDDAVTADARALDRALHACAAALAGAGTGDEAVAEYARALAAAGAYRALPVARAAAIARRTAMAALCASHGGALALTAAVQFVAPRRMVSCIFADGAEGEGVADANLAIDDPDAAGAQHSALWELAALAAHYHPAVRQAAKHIAGAEGVKEPAAAKGAGEAPALVKRFSDAGGGFNPPPVDVWPGKAKDGGRRKARRVLEDKDEGEDDSTLAAHCGALEAIWRASQR